MSGFKTHLYGGMVVGATTSSCLAINDPAMFTPIQLGGIFITGTIGGLLPDLDSDTSKPFSMLFTLLSMIVPTLFFKEISILWLFIMPYIESVVKCLSQLQLFNTNIFGTIFSRFQDKIAPFPPIDNITPEFIVTYFVISYILIRYVFCEIVKRITIHRGIMHSIPFALLCAEVGFIIFIPSGKQMAIAISVSIFLGAIVHLILDEINSITLKYGFIPKLKKSAGTAIKLKSESIITTMIIYIIVIIGGIRITKYFI